ncbi:MAG: hypothetical protein ACLTDV_03205 [Eubacterium sp.]
MMKPMHATVAILTALGTWNDVMTPLGNYVRMIRIHFRWHS